MAQALHEAYFTLIPVTTNDSQAPPGMMSEHRDSIDY